MARAGCSDFRAGDPLLRGTLPLPLLSLVSMRVPGWVNVVLEGGGLDLERALVEYRGLRRELVGAWQPNAAAIVRRSEGLALSAEAVESALDRARRRTRQDPSALAIRELADAVLTERFRLLRSIDAAFSQASAFDSLGSKLLAIQESAREEAFLEQAWTRFHVERWVMTVGTVLLFTLVPLASWWVASEGGASPVSIEPGAVFETPLGVAFLVARWTWLLAACLRAASWQWLGFKRGSRLVVPLVGLSVFAGAALSSAQLPSQVALALVGAALAGAGQLVLSLWRSYAAAAGSR
jgi:hypothetical protein